MFIVTEFAALKLRCDKCTCMLYLRCGFVILILLDFSLTVQAAPHECVIRTSQP